MNKNGKKKSEKYPSLYDAFTPGDRVKRIYKDKNGKSQEYKGIILGIDHRSLEVYWDTRDGKFRPRDMDVTFTTCPIYEIFNGNEYYTPIKRE